MAYKDPRRQAETSKRHYEKNKEKIKARSHKRNKVQRKKNKEFIQSVKKISKCIDCGESNPIVLDFDHVRGEKIAAVSVMASGAYGIDAISREMDKCEVRCSNCHRIITHKRRMIDHELFEQLKDNDCLLADGFEKALIGISEGNNPVAVYDTDLCINILMEEDGMSQDEAVEFFHYNTVRANLGEKTPIFIKRYE